MTRALHGMGHHMAGLVLGQSLVSAFVISFITVQRVTGSAAHTPEIPPVLISLAAQVAGVAVAQIGVGSLLRLLCQFCHIHFRDLLQFLGELSRKTPGQIRHIGLVGICPKTWGHTVRIIKSVVAEDMVMRICPKAPAPGDGLHFARIGIHVGTRDRIDMICMTLAAGGIIELQGTGRSRKRLQRASGRGPAMSDVFVFYFCRRPGVTDHTAIGIAQLPASGKDGLHHAGLQRAGRLDSLVAGKTILVFSWENFYISARYCCCAPSAASSVRISCKQ